MCIRDSIYTEQDSRKDIMRLAALDAGFTTVEFLREPQAAAWHYACLLYTSITIAVIISIIVAIAIYEQLKSS